MRSFALFVGLLLSLVGAPAMAAPDFPNVDTPPAATEPAPSAPLRTAAGRPSVASLGPIAILPNPDPNNAALKHLQTVAGSQLHTLTPEDVVSKAKFNPQKYKLAVYASGETFTRTVKKEADVEAALRAYQLAGGTLLVVSSSPLPFFTDEKGAQTGTAARFGMQLLGNGKEDEGVAGFDTPPRTQGGLPGTFEALFAPTTVFLSDWGSLPSRLNFPATGERRWRPLVRISNDPNVYEPWITLREDRIGKNYGDAAAFIRRVSSDETKRSYRTAFVSHLLTQNNPDSGKILDAVLSRLATIIESTPGVSGTSDRAHIFYYTWYGAPGQQDGYVHWQQGNRTPPDDIGANFYPKLGAYSSTDPKVIAQHMQWIKQAGAGVVSVSWWGRDGYEDRAMKAVMNGAADAGLQVTFHLEPYKDATPEKLANDIGYILLRYSKHPAFYRYNGKAFFYIFETSRHPVEAWRQANDRLHSFSTQPLMIIAQTSDLAFVKKGAFDGGYTYDGLAPFRVPNYLETWKSLATDFKAAKKLFIPSVGPGSWDDRAVPNGADEPEAAKTRDAGKATTYAAAWQAALDSGAPLVSITSFNEWHEGTQIEPAIEKKIEGYTYPPYAGGENEYLKLTRHWIDQLAR